MSTNYDGLYGMDGVDDFHPIFRAKFVRPSIRRIHVRYFMGCFPGASKFDLARRGDFANKAIFV